MINFDSLTLKALLEEIAPILEEGRIQRVQQPSRRELILHIRSFGASHKLYINIEPQFAHMCMMEKNTQELRNIDIPKAPPMFCMLLRKHIEGAKINKIIQPDFERIVEIHLDSHSEIGQKIPLVLAIELMGKHSNVILYNLETKNILGCAHNISPEKSSIRELSGGLPYIYPTKKQKLKFSSLAKQEFLKNCQIIQTSFAQFLNLTFYDISLSLANELCEFLKIDIQKNKIIAIKEEQILQAYDLLDEIVNLKNIVPFISFDNKFFGVYSFFETDIKKESVNEMVDDYFSYHQNKFQIEKLKNKFLALIKKELKKIKIKEEKHKKSLDDDNKAEKYRQLGDILMANLSNIKSGETIAKCQNPYNNNEIEEIEIKDDLTPSANANRYYKLYAKSQNAQKTAKSMLLELKQDENYIETVRISIDNSNTFSELEEIKQELEDQGLLKKKTVSKKQDKYKPEIETIERKPFKIYVGKNNKQNDYIISKLARGNDIWLHTREIPGSHILIKVPSEKIEVPDEILLEGAKLAKEYSQAKESTKVEVLCVRRKYLKKPPGAKLGLVIYSNEEIIIV